MPSNRRAPIIPRIVLLAAALLSAPPDLIAQEPAPVPPARVLATRAELEVIAAHPPKGMSPLTLASVQSRLAVGDFSVGDKIELYVQGDATYTGTFPVREGRVLSLPSLPTLSLEGVLRAEVDSVLSAFLSKYIRDPQVTVTPLIRLGILGGVTKPGYYDVPAQSLLSEMVMTAGGLGAFGDMKRSKVNRGNEEVLDTKAVSVAITNASTLDFLNLQSGDNFNVGVQNPQATLNKVQILTALLAIPLMIVSISAISN